MTNLLIGIGLGGFLFWAGGLFWKFINKVLKERKAKETAKAEEDMTMIAEKIVNKIMSKK